MCRVPAAGAGRALDTVQTLLYVYSARACGGGGGDGCCAQPDRAASGARDGARCCDRACIALVGGVTGWAAYIHMYIYMDSVAFHEKQRIVHESLAPIRSSSAGEVCATTPPPVRFDLTRSGSKR